jgi:transcriptional regulator with XRE-family HTH domain
MNYGKALRIARAIAGVKQNELAARAKVSHSYISLIEKGARRPSTRAITKMCRALHIPEPLFAMLAAEKADVKDIGDKEFETLGLYLARFLARDERDRKHDRRRRVT